VDVTLENPKWAERVVTLTIRCRKSRTFQICIHFCCVITGVSFTEFKIIKAFQWTPLSKIIVDNDHGNVTTSTAKRPWLSLSTALCLCAAAARPGARRGLGLGANLGRLGLNSDTQSRWPTLLSGRRRRPGASRHLQMGAKSGKVVGGQESGLDAGPRV